MNLPRLTPVLLLLGLSLTGLTPPARAATRLTPTQLASVGVPTSSTAFTRPRGWRVAAVTLQGYRARIDGPAIVCLTELGLWSDAEGSGARRWLLSIRRLRKGRWVLEREEPVPTSATGVHLEVANLDADADEELVLRHVAGGPAGDDTVEVRDRVRGRWTRALLTDGDQHRLVDLDGDGAFELLALHRLPADRSPPCSASRVLEPVVHVYRKGAFALGGRRFRAFYAARLAVAVQDEARAPAGSYRRAAGAALVRALRARLRPKPL